VTGVVLCAAETPAAATSNVAPITNAFMLVI
jgi:hypothetical protein